MGVDWHLASRLAAATTRGWKAIEAVTIGLDRAGTTPTAFRQPVSG
jgi:hypothetical protein